MFINNLLRNSASPGELTSYVNIVEASREPFSVLTIHGGSSDIWFALYEEGEPPRRRLGGNLDRVGLSGMNSTVKNSTGQSRDRRALDTDVTVRQSCFYWMGSKRAPRSFLCLGQHAAWCGAKCAVERNGH